MNDSWRGMTTIWQELGGFGVIALIAFAVETLRPLRTQDHAFWRTLAVLTIVSCLDDPILALLALWRSQTANLVFHLFFTMVLVLTIRGWRSGFWRTLDGVHDPAT